MSTADVLEFLSVLGSGIVAGGMVLVLAGVVPTRRGLPLDRATQLHRDFSPRADRLMPPMVAVASVLCAARLVVGDREGAELAALLTGLVALGGVAVLSLGFNMPMNRRIARWPLDAVPAEAGAVFARWDRFHAARAGFAVVAFAALVVAALAD